MTVSYMIIIIIIWRKGSVNTKDEPTIEKSRFRRLLSAKRTVSNSKKKNQIKLLFLYK